jgi:hypothetical protein
MLRMAHCLYNRVTYGDEVVSFTRQPSLSSGIFLVVISVRGRVHPLASFRLERLGQLEIINELVGNRASVPQVTEHRVPRTENIAG